MTSIEEDAKKMATDAEKADLVRTAAAKYTDALNTFLTDLQPSLGRDGAMSVVMTAVLTHLLGVYGDKGTVAYLGRIIALVEAGDHKPKADS